MAYILAHSAPFQSSPDLARMYVGPWGRLPLCVGGLCVPDRVFGMRCHYSRCFQARRKQGMDGSGRERGCFCRDTSGQLAGRGVSKYSRREREGGEAGGRGAAEGASRRTRKRMVVVVMVVMAVVVNREEAEAEMERASGWCWTGFLTVPCRWNNKSRLGSHCRELPLIHSARPGRPAEPLSRSRPTFTVCRVILALPIAEHTQDISIPYT